MPFLNEICRIDSIMISHNNILWEISGINLQGLGLERESKSLARIE